MNKIKILLLLILFTVELSASNKIVGYYPDWGKWMTPAYTYNEIDFSKLTHIAWSFIFPSASAELNGDAIDNPSDLDSLTAKAHENGVKVLISLGGAGQCDNFATVASNDALRAKFIHNLKSYITLHNIDGIDLDWEYSNLPSQSDTAAYTKLINDMRDSLKTDFILTAAIPCTAYYGRWFSVEGFIDKLDWLGIMTYDMTGSWDEAAHYNSPLYDSEYSSISWDSSMKYWESRGVPRSKLLPGVAFFGFTFASCSGRGESFDASKVKYTSYAEIKDSLSWTIYFDSIAQVPYALTPSGSYVTFDNPHSVAEKGRFIQNKGYAGAIVWELTLDYSKSGKTPLLDSLSAILLGKPSAITEHTKIIKENNDNLNIYTLDGKLLRAKVRKENVNQELQKLPFEAYIIKGNQ